MTELSVVIPTYNHGETVERAIDSALAQTLEDIEVIVDDASADDTQTVLDRIGDPRVTRLRHEHNRGSSAARNTGIDHAAGEYVAFLDADDEWFTETFADLIAERGYDERIERLQRFHWSKQQFREGRFREGLRSLWGSECHHHRDALGLGFAFLTGPQRCLG